MIAQAGSEADRDVGREADRQAERRRQTETQRDRRNELSRNPTSFHSIQTNGPIPSGVNQF